MKYADDTDYNALDLVVDQLLRYSPSLTLPKEESVVVPFLKWPGGKRWFTHKYADLLPKKFNRYIEPFLGGGAVFFHLKPEQSILGDLNKDLIDAYQALKDDWQQVKAGLAYRHRQHSKDPLYYYKQRAKEPKKLIDRAIRMIYLNRTCFNGIYRVNREGKFNVPKGTKTAVLLDTDNFKETSYFLRNAELHKSDFQFLIDQATKDDFVFVDPPYTVHHNQNGFIQYNETLFSWADQKRLANSLLNAKERGAKIIATNANHKCIRDLYNSVGFSFKTASRFSQISAKKTGRKQFEELIILANL